MEYFRNISVFRCIPSTTATKPCRTQNLACDHLHTPVSEEQAQTFADKWFYQFSSGGQFKCTEDQARFQEKHQLEYLLWVFLGGQLSTSAPTPPWLWEDDIKKMFSARKLFLNLRGRMRFLIIGRVRCFADLLLCAMLLYWPSKDLIEGHENNFLTLSTIIEISLLKWSWQYAQRSIM